MIKYIKGTVVTTGSTLQLIGNSTLDTNAMVWDNVEFPAATTVVVTLLSELRSNKITYGNTSIVTFAGNFPFIIDTLNNIAVNTSNTLILSIGPEYKINVAMNASSITAISGNEIKSITYGTMAKLTLGPSATFSVDYINFTDIDASGGKAITTIHGLVVNCDNINEVEDLIFDRTFIKEWYCYLLTKSKMYYYSYYNSLGQPVIATDANPKPLGMNPSNLKEMQLTFATNKNYFSGVRTLAMNFTFVGDGADIIRNIKYTGRGYSDEIFFLIERFDPFNGGFDRYYYGKLDLSQTKDTVSGYSVPVIDNSAWGVLSQNDDVKYPIDCNPHNPKTIPVVFDGITLRAKFTYQPVDVLFTVNKIANTLQPFAIPLINTDGDSSSIITNNQTYNFQDDNVPAGTIPDIQNNYIIKAGRQCTITISGVFSFEWRVQQPETASLELGLVSNLNMDFFILGNRLISPIGAGNPKDFNISFSRTILLSEGQSMTMVIKVIDGENNYDWWITPYGTTFSITTDTQPDATIVYARRPLDVLRDVVGRATKNKYVVNSNYFETNPNIVLTCGDALRQAANAQIKTSFRDWFNSYDVEKWIAFRIDKKAIWVEPAIDIYNPVTNLFDIGEVKDVEIEDANEYLINEVELNMNKQDYRHPSGRLEFNGLNTFSVVQDNVKSKLSLVSPYRKDCYGMEFIRMDYQQQSTEDNSGDDTVFMVDITDERIDAQTFVNNFITIEVSNAPLSPIIYYPYNNDTINNNKPTIRGVSIPGQTFNVYIDGLFDGSGVGSGAYGDFIYNVQTPLAVLDDFKDGVHTIELSYSDLTGTTTARTITLTSNTTEITFEGIHDGDKLYNSIPYIRGFMPVGQTADLYIDGLVVQTVTGDGSCRWFNPPYQFSNGNHTMTLGTASVSFSTNNNVEIPLPCSVSFHQGFMPILNNLPIIRGVAKPSTTINIYLDYYQTPIGTVTTTSTNGNWQFQVVPMNKSDGTTLTPIPNGNHVISTSLFIQATPITISGFKLNRPAYTSMEGVLDNSVFNTELTPKHNLLNRMPYWKSIFYQQPDTIIKFETADKNRAFSTTIGGVTIKEASDVKLSDYPDSSLFYPYIFNCTVETPFFFADIVEDFSSGGLVKLAYQGIEILCLPIGKMSVEDVSRDVRRWSLLISTETPLQNLLNLSNPGSIYNVMGESIYRSDYNTLHFVKYESEQDAPEIHEDWFKNRNEQWVNKPQYFQKLQTSDVLIDQIITNFAIPRQCTLTVFDACGNFVTSFPYFDQTTAPISAPKILKQVTVDLSLLGEGDFFFAVFAGSSIACISEPVSIKNKHYGTILIDGGSPKNKTGTVFSQGWRSKIRVEGLVEKWIGNIDTLINEDEIGDYDNLRSIATKKRTVLFGNGQGIPDWLYLKICNTILLDDLKIQGVDYVISKDARVEPVDRIAGYPMYYYSIDFTLKDNLFGYNFTEFKQFPDVPDVTVFQADWGWSAVPFTTGMLPGFSYQGSDVFDINKTITADYTNAPLDSYLVLRYPKSQVKKLNWFNTSFNYGTIPDQVYEVTFEDANFYYAYTRTKPVLSSSNKKIIYT